MNCPTFASAGRTPFFSGLFALSSGESGFLSPPYASPRFLHAVLKSPWTFSSWCLALSWNGIPSATTHPWVRDTGCSPPLWKPSPKVRCGPFHPTSLAESQKKEETGVNAWDLRISISMQRVILGRAVLPQWKSSHDARLWKEMIIWSLWGYFFKSSAVNV